MKQFIIISILLILGLLALNAVTSNPKSQKKQASSTLANKAIQFYDGSWEEIKAKSKSEKKSIFLDVSATWCPPCNKLKSTTFKDTNVINYLNANFINIKLDENDKKVPFIYKKFKIVSFPTLLFLDSSGNELSRVLGYVDSKAFLQSAKQLKK